MNPVKLYVVVRDDISPGLQAAQSVHAALSFAQEFPKVTSQWHRISDYVIILSVKDLDALEHEFSRIPVNKVMFFEPDLGDEPTAFSTLGYEAGTLLSHLPLALRNVRRRTYGVDNRGVPFLTSV